MEKIKVVCKRHDSKPYVTWVSNNLKNFQNFVGGYIEVVPICKYATKFMACVNILATGNLVPIKFAEHHRDEKLMSPKKRAPVLALLNRFVGWSATFEISFVENAYSLEQIVQIINLAGFGLGIGSGRSSGYGRYHVVGMQVIE